MKKNLYSILLLALAAMTVSSCAGTGRDLDGVIQKTALYLQKKVTAPSPASIGGDWTVIALVRSGEPIADGYFESYLEQAGARVKNTSFVDANFKHTEYSRTILALTALGMDASDISGYSLVELLFDYDNVIKQGVNGAAFALLAIDSGNYTAQDRAQNTRVRLLEHLLSKQLPDGGFSLGEVDSDPDVTAMALCALAKYMSDGRVANAVNRAIALLSSDFQRDGYFLSMGRQSCESVSQVIVALCELGIDPCGERFSRNGETLIDRLLDYYMEDGSFEHTLGGGANLYATEQGFLALVSYRRLARDCPSVYRMSISETQGEDPPKEPAA